ncbi:hypothetical protein E1212_03035 [Jiangella ureilytica]|uniref:Sulfotransferase family protein n=1 Tax=Jiangella ureilytica TaxID=2530374 RepID=A0A4R4RYF7_9ACTN|nr:hypothetical protein [Jiangella ureilytica]TDC54429.1 hypothetical protein E1212_03035 [Jiangella ureilytica]
MTFVRSCRHIDNYTAGHESLAPAVGAERFAYPQNHIEADNRLSWFLGELRSRFADALFVHLRRDPAEVADSFVRRWDNGHRANIVKAFSEAIVPHRREPPVEDRPALARFYVDTVRTNIDAFMATVPYSMTIDLEQAKEQLPDFWYRLGAEGDLDAATAEFEQRYNASVPT